MSIGGGCDPKTAFFVIPSYIGMGLTGFLIPAEEWTSENNHPLLWLLCLIDIFYGLAQFGSLLIAGPSIYLFGSSASLLYLAVGYKLIYGRNLSPRAWYALLVISVGLCFSANVSFATLAPAVSINNSTPAKSSVNSDAVGILLASIASLLHSGSTMILEFLLVEKRLSAPTICSRIGNVGMFVYGIWTAYYTIPDFMNKVKGAANEPLYQIIVVFGILTLNSLFHALTMMSVVSTLGGTSAGVVKIVLGICVFTMGHILFCNSTESEECFTTNKAISSLLTSTGILLYMREEAHTRAEYTEIKDEESQDDEMKE